MMQKKLKYIQSWLCTDDIVKQKIAHIVITLVFNGKKF